MLNKTGTVLRFSDVEKHDVSVVGQKAVVLGELSRANIPIAPGFIISAQAYQQFLKQNNLTAKIKHMLGTVDYNRPESLLDAAIHIRRYIKNGTLDETFAHEVFTAYKHLGGVFHHANVNLIASETSNHLFHRGEFEHNISLHNVSGEANLLVKIRELWASLFDAHAIFRRYRHDLSHFTAGMGVIVQKNLAADASGVLFTIDPITNDRNHIVIEARAGITERDGTTNPPADMYVVNKNDQLILKKTIATQRFARQIVGNKTAQVSLSQKDEIRPKITDEAILSLATLAKTLEKTLYFPHVTSWVKEKKKLYLYEIRPLEYIKHQTTFSKENGVQIMSVTPASAGVATGRAIILNSEKDVHQVLPGDIIITNKTSELMVPAIKKAGAVVTEESGLTSHAAFLSRSLGKPAVIGATDAKKLIKSHQVITVNGTSGTISRGPLTHTPLTTQEDTLHATKLFLEIRELKNIDETAQLGTSGVGLLPAEFLFNALPVHPKKYIQSGKSDRITHMLVEQIKPLLKAFSPRPVFYRFSHFTTDELRTFPNGKLFDPEENNPLLGYRGAFRTMHDPTLFDLEIEAIKAVRNKASLKTISLLLPFVRSAKELTALKQRIAALGLHRSPTCKVIVQIQIPANAFMLDEFMHIGIDGIDIDIDTLTALLLATDNNNEEVIQAFDPMNPAIIAFVELLIKKAHALSLPVTLSGKAMSRYPVLVEHAVAWGVHGITVRPESFEATKQTVIMAEKKVLQTNSKHG